MYAIFSRLWAKKWRFSLKQCYDPNKKTSRILNKTRQFFATFFGEYIFKIISIGPKLATI
jgi:hypothetical protein